CVGVCHAHTHWVRRSRDRNSNHLTPPPPEPGSVALQLNTSEYKKAQHGTTEPARPDTIFRDAAFWMKRYPVPEKNTTWVQTPPHTPSHPHTHTHTPPHTHTPTHERKRHIQFLTFKNNLS